MAKKKAGRKVRVEFRQNRQAPGRRGDLTRRYQRETDAVEDAVRGEQVRARGDLSRKRTVILGEGDAPTVDESLWLRGDVTAVHGLVCFVDDGQGAVWACTVRRILRTLLIESRSPVTVGDRVWFSDQSRMAGGELVGVIERIKPRSSMLSRRDARGRQHTIVANADQLLIVGSVAEPKLKPHLIDRYLVAAHNGNLRPVVCLNKIDLVGPGVDPADVLAYTQTIAADVDDIMDEPEHEAITVGSVLAELREIGYTCFATSAASGAGLDELRGVLQDHITVLSGQSGVGKSSLLNALQPGLDLSVAEVSEDTEKGKHTTTHARLLRLDFGGYVVDTPGIRAFDLWEVNPAELEVFFPEFVEPLQHCHFKDCLHRDEEGCAVRAAVEAGEISLRRYLSYLKMFDETAAGTGW
jgi:ribosome biogenesis GTPase / thiamine phosphate phosphatase